MGQYDKVYHDDHDDHPHNEDLEDKDHNNLIEQEKTTLRSAGAGTVEDEFPFLAHDDTYEDHDHNIIEQTQEESDHVMRHGGHEEDEIREEENVTKGRSMVHLYTESVHSLSHSPLGTE